MEQVEQAQTIGRFAVRRLLGQGAQSAVFLAWDPHLEREVAIKIVRCSDAAPGLGGLLLHEARAVAKLRHPNTVPIFEAGEQDGDPYLIFEYVEGPTLAQLLVQQGPLPAVRAAEIVCGVLASIDEAHRQGLVHRDLKPSNILISGDGEPRVMDFGIATRLVDAPQQAGNLAGTPAYMAPEYIESREYTVRSDVFAVGLILYEMVSGERAVSGGSAIITMQNIVTGRFCLSLEGAGRIDAKLRAIVSRATALDPALRFGSAAQMLQCLQHYLRPETQPPAAAAARGKGALGFVLRRMQLKGDFPALSESIRTINRLTTSDGDSVTTLANAIVKDFALTNRILRLVNSAHYRRAGAASIGTVSRAIVVLGSNAIRDIAISLILVEHVQNQTSAALLKEELLRASFSGAMARELAGELAIRETEEAYICSMMRNLGRFLAQYYLAEEADEVRRVIRDGGASEDSASIQVLGMSYQALGIGVARAWGFPDDIVDGLRPLGKGPLRPPKSREDMLRAIAGFANEVCFAIEASAGCEFAQRLGRARKRYGSAIPIAEPELRAAIQRALSETTEFCAVARLNIKESRFGKLLFREIPNEYSNADPESTMTSDGAETMLTAVTMLEPTMIPGAKTEIVAGPHWLAAGAARP